MLFAAKTCAPPFSRHHDFLLPLLAYYRLAACPSWNSEFCNPWYKTTQINAKRGALWLRGGKKKPKTNLKEWYEHRSSRFWKCHRQSPPSQAPKKQTRYLSHHCSHFICFNMGQEDRNLGRILLKQSLWHNQDFHSWMCHKNRIGPHLSWMIRKFSSLDTGAEKEDLLTLFPALWFSGMCSQSCPHYFKPNFARGKHITGHIIQTVSLERILEILSTLNSSISISSWSKSRPKCSVNEAVYYFPSSWRNHFALILIISSLKLEP